MEHLANFDDEVFADPTRLDLGHKPSRHIAFRRGARFCLDAFLGRVHLESVLVAVRELVDVVEVAAPPRRLYSNFVLSRVGRLRQTRRGTDGDDGDLRRGVQLAESASCTPRVTRRGMRDRWRIASANSCQCGSTGSRLAAELGQCRLGRLPGTRLHRRAGTCRCTPISTPPTLVTRRPSTWLRSGCAGGYSVSSRPTTKSSAHAQAGEDDQYWLALTRFAERDLSTFASMIPGFPGEAAGSVRRSADFLNEKRPTFWRVQAWWGQLALSHLRQQGTARH